MSFKFKLQKKELFFLVKFFVIFAILHFLLFFLPLQNFQEWIAQLMAELLGLPLNGTLLFIGQQGFEITKSCTGLVSSFILASVVFALKKPILKMKLSLWILGTVLLLIVNLFRVYLVLFLGILFGVQIAEFAHIISWFLMSGLILVFWYYATIKLTGIKSFKGFL